MIACHDHGILTRISSTSRSVSLEDLQEEITAQLEDFRIFLQDFGNRVILGEDFPAVNDTLAHNITSFIGPGFVRTTTNNLGHLLMSA